RLSQARSQPGIGLGLSIVKQWVERMGGALQIDSAPGAGTAVKITLTAPSLSEADMDSYCRPDALGVLPQIDGKGKTVWLAEDTPDIRRLLADELTGQGFAVDASENGLELIRKMQRLSSSPDLILTDHMMPGANGLAVLAEARQRLPGVPVVAISALPQPIGPQSYDASLLKPINLAELRNTLASLLQLGGPPFAETPPDASHAQRPDASQLEEARRLISLGAMTDLLDWAEHIAQDNLRCQDFIERLRQLVRQGELSSLQALCEE
ncbi:response regulator, partial [Chromobacterium subtsugae]